MNNTTMSQKKSKKTNRSRKNKIKQKTIYKLYGVLSHKEGNKIFLGGHIETYEKLKNIHKKICKKKISTDINFLSPLKDGNKFYILANGIEFLDSVFGEKHIIWAFVKKYKFTSQFSHNKGSIIEGWNLYMTKAEKNGNW
jgi:hypothetical protein